jgi:hypothetical protein
VRFAEQGAVLTNQLRSFRGTLLHHQRARERNLRGTLAAIGTDAIRYSDLNAVSRRAARVNVQLR